MPRKHIATRTSPITNELRKQVKLANQRLRRLERSNVPSRALTHFKTAMGERIKIPRKPTAEDARKIQTKVDIILKKDAFTIKGARAANDVIEERFTNMMRKISPNMSESGIKALYDYMGDIDVKTLTEEYSSEQIAVAADEMVTAGILPTAERIRTALKDGIERVVEEVLVSEGISRNDENFDLYVNIGADNGIDKAIEQWRANNGTL